MGFEHQAISHVSGSVTLLGIKATTNPSAALLLLSIIISFMLGSALSGFLLSGGSLKLGRHYDTLLLLKDCYCLRVLIYSKTHSFTALF
ncbi:DUF1275 family protein [Pseudoalteromonas sp. B193]